METTDKGWAYPTTTARKAHYFRADGRSMCGNYGSFMMPPAAFEPEYAPASSADCASCRRRLDTEGVR